MFPYGPTEAWSPKLCTMAAETGNLEALRLLRERTPPCPWHVNEVREVAAGGGHMEILRWLAEQEPPRQWKLNWAVCSSAVRGGQLETFKWLDGQGCFLYTNCCRDAAQDLPKGAKNDLREYLKETRPREDIGEGVCSFFDDDDNKPTSEKQKAERVC